MSDELVGTIAGHYEVLAKLGGGGMGIVYKARDTRLERLVALKFLPSQWSHDEDAKKRFMREAQAASATDHPNICTVHDIGEATDGQLFIVMAYYQGVTLKERLERGPLPVDEALELATQVAQGLARAHRTGVVHRDIKPSNLILTDDAVKIVDFGLAKFADSLHLTVTAAAPVGTFTYMSPEQVKAEEATAQSDVWAAGVVLYEMLTGHPPFRGGYFEAVAHAIRYEAPPSIRSERPEVPEAVERLVFRAMHKDPAVRFLNGRDLALALLQVRGLSAPLDLRSGVVEVPQHLRDRPRTRRRKWLVPVGAALALAATLAVGVMWRSRASTGPRASIAVVPVVNQTGYPELSPYRLALTYALIHELGDSPNVRPLDYGRLVQLVRPVLATGGDASSRELQRRLSIQARWTIVPTLLHDNGAWRARAEVKDGATGSTVAMIETDSVATSLTRDAAYSRIVALAALLDQHFADATGGYAPEPRPPGSRLRTLDAVQAVEAGLASMEVQEYGQAREAFARAATLDAQHPLPNAWLSRAEQLLRDANAAGEAADRAFRLVTDDTLPSDVLLARAVWATTRQDIAAAESHYRELAARWPDEPRWSGELAAFYESQGRLDEAVAIYQRLRAGDQGLPKFDLDLCRVFARKDDLARAREHARLAQTRFRDEGFRSGQAQALLCEADVLRQGGAAEKQQALAASFDALGIFEASGQPYNAARASQYVAIALAVEGREGEAVQSWERALAGARATGNRGLEAGVLTNLGVASQALGRRRQSLAYYQQGIALNEFIGDERAAARSQANAAAILVDYGPDPSDGARRVQSALTVFRKIGDRSFELLGLRVLGTYHRDAGRAQEANVLFEQALAIARETGLEDAAIGVRLDMASNLLAQGQLVPARAMLEAVAREKRSRDTTHAMVLIGAASARLGDFAAAEKAFARAAAEVAAGGYGSVRSLLLVSRGELAMEHGDVVRARSLFGEAARVASDDLPDAAAAAGEAYRAFLNGARARLMNQSDLDKALAGSATLGWVGLEGLCRLLKATLLLRAGETRRAVEAAGAENQSATGLDPELAARLQAVKAEAFGRLGDEPAAAGARAEVRRLLDGVRTAMTNSEKELYSKRPIIAALDKLSAS